jgi:hypothetical protein
MNHYLRNRLFKFKARKRAVRLCGGEFGFKASFPYWGYGLTHSHYYGYEEQLKDRQKLFEEYWVRKFDSGIRICVTRRTITKKLSRRLRRANQVALRKVFRGEENVEFPLERVRVNWFYLD